MSYAFTIEPGGEVSLMDYDPDHTGGLSKDEALLKLDKLGKEMGELQELLFAASDTALLIVLQGMDTSGKDGAIQGILKHTNVQSCRVTSFKVPTEDERAHDYLWRVHKEVPRRGAVGIFNRSHYEDVLVVRVHNLTPKEIWKARYQQINEFESLISSNKTIIVKFFLHIDKDEQQQRLLDREEDTTKAWKLAVNDWKERELWSQYQKAYEDALSKCSTEQAPWCVVPSNHKWFRDLAVVERITDALRPYRDDWMERLTEIGKTAKAELAEHRAAQKRS